MVSDRNREVDQPMRYSLRFLLLMTAWLGTQLGVYAVSVGKGWDADLIQAQILLTWAPVAIGFGCTVLPDCREKIGLGLLSAAGLLFLSSCWCRLVVALPDGWAVHLVPQARLLAVSLLLAGLILLVASRATASEKTGYRRAPGQ
jgi:hypothetical protein